MTLRLNELSVDVFPQGWYALMAAADLPREGIHDFEAWGRKLVAFRTESGRVVATDRFCPHMGASLGAGFVRGERIVCPFHHWEYGDDGVCKKIPYLEEGEKIPKGARVDHIPTVEHLGWIWVHNGPVPLYDLPHVPEAEDGNHMLIARTSRMNTHFLHILENGTDVQHFKYVHNVDFTSTVVECIADSEHELGFDIAQTLASGGREVTTTIHYYGASVIFGRVIIDGRQLARFVAAPLPVSANETVFNLLVLVKRLPWWLRPLDPLFGRFMARKILDGSTDDYGPVWSQMDPSRRGVLVGADKTQQRFRKYYRSHLAGQ